MRQGLFIVFEGIDGSGKTTQVNYLASLIRELDKYNDVLITREPTRRQVKIKKRLEEDKEAYSGAMDMALLYVEGDRIPHTQSLIVPVLQQGISVICDRYKMSTDAYQSAQGLEILKLIEMQNDSRILVPDLTFLVTVPPEVASARILKRKQEIGQELEKFEQSEFLKKVAEQYMKAVEIGKHFNIYGKLIIINGNQEPEKVSQDIKQEFTPFYREWEKR